MSLFDVKCPGCSRIDEISGPIGRVPIVECPTCGIPMKSYFGRMQAEDVQIAYGFREQRYDNETDRNIAKFQFTHL